MYCKLQNFIFLLEKGASLSTIYAEYLGLTGIFCSTLIAILVKKNYKGIFSPIAGFYCGKMIKQAVWTLFRQKIQKNQNF